MYKLGIDVGGTNTDAVLIDESMNVVAAVKQHTTKDVYGGIMNAVDAVLEESGVDAALINQAMLGTTQCTNAIVERKGLSPNRHLAYWRTCHRGHSSDGGLGGFHSGCVRRLDRSSAAVSSSTASVSTSSTRKPAAHFSTK